MARPPIIISNGSVFNLLTKDVKDPDAVNKVRENLKEIYRQDKTENKLTEVVLINDMGEDAPYLYWRLKDDDDKYEDKIKKYKDPQDTEYNDVFDDKMDGMEGESIISKVQENI